MHSSHALLSIIHVVCRPGSSQPKELVRNRSQPFGVVRKKAAEGQQGFPSSCHVLFASPECSRFRKLLARGWGPCRHPGGWRMRCCERQDHLNFLRFRSKLMETNLLKASLCPWGTSPPHFKWHQHSRTWQETLISAFLMARMAQHQISPQPGDFKI